MRLAERTSLVTPSATVSLTARVAELREAGKEIIDFGTGEPDFDTPEHIKSAAVEALRAGMTKYTPVGGILPLKRAIVEKLRRDNGLFYTPAEVTAGCGGKQVLFNALQVLLNTGDEVILPAPYWVSYPDMVRLAGARPRIVETREEKGFKMSPEQLEGAIGPRTKAVILNSPCNPTGAVYSREELADLADVVERSGLIAISDDVYEKLVYGDFPLSHLVRVNPRLRERVVIINSLSKTYAMTGGRIGYAAAPAEVISAMETLQGQSTHAPNSLAQAAAVAALTGPQDTVTEMVREFARRRDYVVEQLRTIRGVSCTLPEGAFYIFPNLSAYLGRKGTGNTHDLARYLLEEAGVAVVAGWDFGAPHHIRLSYATSLAHLERGLRRMRAALDKLA